MIVMASLLARTAGRTWAGAVTLLLLGFPLSAQKPEVKWLEWGFEQRVRNENTNNVWDYSDGTDDERNQVRYRSRLWIKIPLSHTVDLFAGLNQETKQVVTPHAPFRFDEVIFESAYVDFKRLFTNGLSLRAGRQNLMRGEGFLLAEGNPHDGSRSTYFNAVDLAYAWRKSKLELMAISNPQRDHYLPRIHDRSRRLVDWNDRAIGLYYTSAESARTTIESYYFYKTETGDPRPATHLQYQPDRRFHTAGGRLVRQLNRGWSATGEFALQRGHERETTPIGAWAGYAYAKKDFAGGWHPYALFGYWGFSGDDPETHDRIEGWDPLFARWPKWSELYVYTYATEKGAGYWTNMGMWQAELGFTPWKPLNCRLTYYHMDAYHPVPQDPAMFGPGTLRGNHYQGRVGFQIGEHWKGHVLLERHLPGDFYSHRSAAYFLRFELTFLVQGRARM